MIYLFTGEDVAAKDAELKRLKQEFLPKELAQFNCDTLYAKGLTLKETQEKLLCLPLKCKYRMVVIRDAGNLDEEILEFLSRRYLKNPAKQIILVLDWGRADKKDVFFRELSRQAKVIRFKEAAEENAFTLSDQIALKRPDAALRILHQLLITGERPERILGGLRYAWERDISHPEQTRKKLKSLLNCDIEIKTGRLKPAMALEKLVITLCSFV